MPAKFLLPLFIYLIACNSTETRVIRKALNKTAEDIPQEIHDIPTPSGYQRDLAAPNSFKQFLRSIKLKSDKTVYLFNGEKKKNQSAQFAVLDITVGNRDLQQCADAVMRLRADYLFKEKRFSEIIFNDNDSKAYAFNEPFTKTNFDKYLLKVFGACGSASLSKQLISKNIKDITAGDVFIRGGFPGHAVIVMDVASNSSGKKAYLLAQSYMPAQDVHVLLNPIHETDPWYYLDDSKDVITPEYSFLVTELKTWK